MDKASTIKDAIEYIQKLHEQEQAFQYEITELEFGRLKKSISDIDLEHMNLPKTKKTRIEHILILGLCEVFESLKLKIITANISAVSGRL
ncbi:hypothetical protein MKX01_035432 [Papaver californicum]|nr:hypothetical protein MKX01_035432 [Papaver californicum]